MSFSSAKNFADFDWRKSVAAVTYLAERTKESLYLIMKMMYLADKAHLDRYGRFISGDWYVAMKKGPVPSETYCLLKSLRENDRSHRFFDSAAKSIQVSSDNVISSIDRRDFDELSESDIECLDAIIETYDVVGKWAVTDMSHDVVWDHAWSKRGFFKENAPMGMDTIAEHVGGKALVAHVRDPQPGSA